jgi:hypothetical protein
MKASTTVILLSLAAIGLATPVKRDVDWTEKYVKPE